VAGNISSNSRGIVVAVLGVVSLMTNRELKENNNTNDSIGIKFNLL
jgi:hypothetical protein